MSPIGETGGECGAALTPPVTPLPPPPPPLRPQVALANAHELLLNNIRLKASSQVWPGSRQSTATKAKNLADRLKRLRTGGSGRGDGESITGRTLLADGQAETLARDTATFLSSPEATFVMQV